MYFQMYFHAIATFLLECMLNILKNFQGSDVLLCRKKPSKLESFETLRSDCARSRVLNNCGRKSVKGNNIKS